jgi:hypothetical protein
MTNNFYVYAHLRMDKLGRERVFYIGKGMGNRDRNIRGSRSIHHLNIVQKVQCTLGYKGIKVVRLKDNLTEEESFVWEKHFISFYGRQDLGVGSLINLTDGGDGISGFVPSQETRLLQSERAKQRLAKPEERHILSERARKRLADPEQRRRLSESAKRAFSKPETRKRMSDSAKKRAPNPETMQKMLEGSKQRWSDPGARYRMSEQMKQIWARRKSEAVI